MKIRYGLVLYDLVNYFWFDHSEDDSAFYIPLEL